MEDPHQFFSIPKHMNKGRRLLGFPADEIAPALIIFGLSFWLKHEMIGLALSLGWFGGYATSKRNTVTTSSFCPCIGGALPLSAPLSLNALPPLVGGIGFFKEPNLYGPVH
ncbi:type IV conjugative transfer system protein TraL [Vibrio vulnificus]|uniref:type IV conjugative transfer system protein TraL n=1 Tax=Vibrio vulnificus TaxID=672 RepID=UPI003C1303D1